jgi:methyl-accepting chemotaxis protein
MKTLLDRLSLVKKFAIFGVLGIALLAAPLFMYFRMSHEIIVAARMEQAGIEPVKALLRVIQFTQQHRGLSANVLGGNAGLEAQRAAKQAETDKAVEAFTALIKSMDNSKLAASWAGAAQNWKALAQEVAGRTIAGKESYAKHTSLVAEYLIVVELVADHFGLTLDPEAGTYQLVMATVFHLPHLTESLGQARARGSLYLSQKSITADDKAALAALAGIVKMHHENMRRAVNKALESDPALKRNLDSVTQESATQAERAMKLVQAELIEADKLTFSGPEYFKILTEVIDAQFKLNASALEELDKQLIERVSSLRSDQLMVLGAIALVSLLSVWLGIAVTRSVLGQMGGEPADAMEVANRVAAGDLTKEIALRPGDTGSLMASMAKMQGAIKEIVAAQTEMKKQHDAGTISYRIDAARFAGSYGEMARMTNELVAAQVAATMRVVEVVSRYAAGDLSVDMDRLPGEKARITEAVDGVKASLKAVNAQIQSLVEAAGRGDFTVRGDEAAFEHEFRKMVAALNRLMQTSDTALNEVVRVLGALAKGDLTEKITNEYQGTFGRVKDDSNKTVEQLTSIVGSIKESVAAINVASKEIASGNTDLSQRTEEQASSLEETAASTEELTGTVKQNAENARQANQLAAGASEVAGRGGEVVRQVVTTMGSISESSKKIVDIISVIDGIAFQTNILALNAAVEAARAGEQGRGFAVVATEVRNLAQRSAAAAKEIKELIGNSVEKVEHGTRLVDEAGKTMEEIVMSVKRVTDIMSEIMAASQEQSGGIEQVNQAITQMDQVTQQNAALVEEAAAAAESLDEQARSLAEAVAVFRVAQGTASAPRAVARPVPAKSATARPEAKLRALPTAKPALKPVAAAPKAKAAAGTDKKWEEF